MRLNEICQLDVTDVRSIDGVQCIVISEKSQVGSMDKILKTGASERVVPLNRNLLDCGFMRYVGQQRGAGETKLFGDIDPGTKGIRAVAFSKWFTQSLRACDA
jgi:integrase